MTPASPIAVGAAPVPAGVRSVLVFGGTFDPPHVAHVKLPIAARDHLGLDWLLYVPAARSPHKPHGPIASDLDRLAMLEAALRGRDRVSISTYELEHAHDGPSYTVETLRALHVLLPSAVGLRLLIGADQAAEFHRWREPGEIIVLAEPAVLRREPMETVDSLMEAMRPHWTNADLEAWRSRVVPVSLIDASATDARRALSVPDPPAPVGPLIPADVLRIISDRGLYRAG